MMNIPKFPCKNHPDRYSSRKCFWCKDFICSECQVTWYHHIFCSVKCSSRYIIRILFNWINRRLEYVYVLAVMLCLQFIFYLMLEHSLESRLERKGWQIRDDSMHNAADDSVYRLTVDTSFVPAPNQLWIRGTAPGNMILGLWHNGQFVTSTVSHHHQYELQSPYLSQGRNTFVVWAFSDQGRITRIDSIDLNYHSAYLAHLTISADQIKTDQNYLAITFDAGASAHSSDSILAVLEEKGVQCTFFLTGHFIKTYPDLVRQLVNSGHELANHTYSHPHLTRWEQDHKHTTAGSVDRAELQRQLQRTDSLYNHLIHQPLRPYWRAPYGEYNTEILQWAAEIGYRHIGWSPRCDSWDWVSDPASEIYRSSDQIYQHFRELEEMGNLKGAIILMHLGTERKSDYVFHALVKLIDLLQQKNYQILTISQLLAKTNVL